MKSSGRKVTQCVGYLLRSNLPRFRGRFAAQHVRQHGARCDCRHAALRFEARRGDPSALHPHGQPHHIAADRVRHLSRRRGIWQLTGIMRIAEVLDERVLEHALQYKAEHPTLKSALAIGQFVARELAAGYRGLRRFFRNQQKNTSTRRRETPQKTSPPQLNAVDTRRLTTYF